MADWWDDCSAELTVELMVESWVLPLAEQTVGKKVALSDAKWAALRVE